VAKNFVFIAFALALKSFIDGFGTTLDPFGTTLDPFGTSLYRSAPRKKRIGRFF
jgi:hypothetical protein